MITKITAENSSRYDVLFDSIGKYLTNIATNEIEAPMDPESEEYKIYSKWKQIIDEIQASGAEDIYFEKNENGDIKTVKIESLEAYFGIIRNLIDINPEYGIIPLDEPYFEINANTRVIKIPPNFSVQVAGDESAETIFFKIDRYYDIWDLYHDDINIVIQWENARGEKGISEPWIKLLDPNSEDDYIIFGWAITSTVRSSLSGMAAAPGVASFSIKFYKQGNDNSITYCLNTLPARLSISSGLSIDLNDDALIKEKNMKDIMLERFSNGLVKGVTPPPPPTIVYQNIVEGNTYIVDVDSDYEELIVVASTPSAGTLSHKWFKYNENDKRWEQCTRDPGGYETGEKSIKHEISDLSNLQEDFFSLYMIYAEPTLETRITNKDEIEEYSEETGKAIVYLKGYYLQVTSPGKYYCSVINHKGLLNTSQLSKTATFPEPLIPSVPQEIKSVGYVTDKNISLTPSITLPTEESTCPKTYAYAWLYKENENDENLTKLEDTTATLILDTTNPTITDRNPEGYYLCQVFHSVNNTQTPSEDAPYQTWRVVSAKDLKITADYSLYEFNNNDKEIAAGNEISTGSTFNLYSLDDGTIELTVNNYDDKYDTIYYAADANSKVSDETSWNISNGKVIKIDFELGKLRYIHIKKLVGEGEYISTSPVFTIGILAINSGE